MRHNSLRLRLTRSEVARFAEHGEVSEQIEFGAGVFLEYVLAKGSCLHASLANNRLLVTVPEEAAFGWTHSEQVGIAGEQKDGETALAILIEKDFQCAHGEKEADAYPSQPS